MRVPVSGRVVALQAQPGEAVQPDKGLLELSPVAREVVAELEHKVARELVVGARAEFSADGLDEALEGSILRIEDFGTGAPLSRMSRADLGRSSAQCAGCSLSATPGGLAGSAAVHRVKGV